MPAIRRTARSCALSIISLGVVATGSLGVSLAAAPAQAADREAVALNEGQYAEVEKRDAKLRDSAQRKEASRLQTAVSVALNQRGDAYVYGASGPNAFDCSGLVQYSYR
jgi:cell wall-associated NlpC family hydrolase